MDDEEIIVPKSISNTAGDANNCKGSIELYSFMNDIGMNRLRDKVAASSSIVLNKQQLTRHAFVQKHENKQND
jgi:hypothetical protein